MSVLTIQPSDIDTYLNQTNPTTNYGGSTTLRVASDIANGAERPLLKFDFSSLPDGAVISAAVLSLRYYAKYGAVGGRTYWAYELTQTEWVELEATWNNYKSGNAWAAAGGDYIEGDGASTIVPSLSGWMNWNVLALVQHFQSSHGKVAHFLVRDSDESADPYCIAYFRSNAYPTDITLRPKLVITYTAAGTTSSTTTTSTSSSSSTTSTSSSTSSTSSSSSTSSTVSTTSSSSSSSTTTTGPPVIMSSRYNLHTTEYSEQGWDIIFSSDMEKIDSVVPIRILGILGESVNAYEPLYLNTANGKWYKAQANGVKQPCLGLAVEEGILNDEIRIHRMGEIISPSWNWIYIGRPVYLSPAVAGELKQRTGGINSQVIGYAVSATKILVDIEKWDLHPLTTTSTSTSSSTTTTAP